MQGLGCRVEGAMRNSSGFRVQGFGLGMRSKELDPQLPALPPSAREEKRLERRAQLVDARSREGGGRVGRVRGQHR